VSSLFALGLILFVITFIVLSAAKLMLLACPARKGQIMSQPYNRCETHRRARHEPVYRRA
jgi:hypothetical protein